MSLKEQILSAVDIKSETVEIPEWGVTVEVRGLTGKARAQVLEASLKTSGGLSIEKFYPEIIAASVHDPDTGEKVFGAEDKPALLHKSGAVLDRIAEAGIRLSGMSPAALVEAGKN